MVKMIHVECVVTTVTVNLVTLGFLYHQQNEFAMPRLMLSDEFWSKLEKILLQEAIYNKRNLRMTVEGMLYRMRVGCP